VTEQNLFRAALHLTQRRQGRRKYQVPGSPPEVTDEFGAKKKTRKKKKKKKRMKQQHEQQQQQQQQ